MQEITQPEFEAKVLKSATPVLVDFFTADCGPCKQLAPALEELAKENTATLTVVKVDAIQASGLSNSYRIATVPTLLLFYRGNVVAQYGGFRGKKDLQKWLTENLTGCR